MDIREQLFSRPLPSNRTGAFFNAFSYPTKISPESIAVYIASLTKPGETVLDTFGGSGSTGIAALLCEHPTSKMIELAESLGVSPVWGKRNAISYELGTYGSFAARTITNRLSSKEFTKTVEEFVCKAEKELKKYYQAKDPNGEKGEIRHVIWTEVLLCPSCKTELAYFDNAVQRNPVCFKSSIKCPTCGCETNVDDMDFVVEDYYDSVLQKKLKRKKRIPAWVYGSTDGKNWDRAADDDDISIEKKLENNCHSGDIKRIQWGELHRSGYHYGINYLHQFYTCRNYYVMNTLWKMTEEYEEKLRDALRLLLLSYNASNCTMMTRVVAKKNSKDFVLTGAQSGVLYISRLPVEKNILLGLKRKARPISEAYKLLEKCTGTYTVHNASSRKLVEKNESVDFVFTDPPFGDFIPYAEVNQINELWLDKATERTEEIIISESQRKSLTEYQTMLTDVFCEICRVLKPSGYATVVFHAAKAKVWEAFKGVIDESGLYVRHTSILDKKQASFKQVVSEDSVQGDPLILLEKNMVRIHKPSSDGDLLKEIWNRVLDENDDERRIYSLYVNECLSRNVEVKYDAKEAYEIIRRIRKV